MTGIHITDIEAAINWWRERRPSPDGLTACAEVRALAEVYGLMVYYREIHCDETTMPAGARAAWLAWYASTPDAPCIAICSTSQGDAICKGCGRSFDEVQHWPGLSPVEKRSVWRRITMEGTAWRFNRYAERAPLATGEDHPNAESPPPAARDGSPVSGRPGPASARRIAPLAWPVFVGQLSVLAFATIDTVLVARASAIDLAALAVGSGLHHGLHRPDGRGAGAVAHRRPALRRR
jgi:predicted Fe-S protein YdhL (DUF1289 family)